MFESRFRLIAFLAVCLVFFLNGGTVKADASPGINLTIEAGFDGRCKLGGISPVVVGVESGESGSSGLLKVKVDERTYCCRVELEGGVRKEVRFSIPFFRANDRIESVFESGGRVLAEAINEPEVLTARTVFIGVVCDSPQRLYYLKEMDTSELGGGKVEVVTLDRKFAYSLEELEDLNFIVVEDYRKADFGEHEAAVLRDWVRLGNCMLIGPGENPTAVFAGAAGDSDPPTLLGDGVIVPVGGGVLDRPPQFIQGVIMKHVTPYAVAKAINGSGRTNQIKGAGNLSGVADDTLRPDKNTTCFILSLLALYMTALLVTVFFARRREWAYSLLVGVFCLVFLGLSFLGGVFEPIAAGAAVRVHGSAIRTYTLTCVHTYAEEEVRAKIPGAHFTSGLDGEGWESDPLSGEVRLSGKTGRYIYASSIEMNDEEAAGLSVDRNGVLLGEVKNPLPDRLENCFVIIGDTVIPVGSLAGREKILLDYRLDHNLKGFGDYNYLAALYRASGGQSLHRQLIDYYFYSVEDWEAGGRLIGFCSEAGEVEVNGSRRKAKQTVMNVFRVAVEGVAEEVYLPSEAVRPVVDRAGEDPGNEGTVKREYPGGQREIDVYFVMPQGVKPLEICFAEPPGRGGESVRVYNRNQKTWETVGGEPLVGEKLQACVYDGPLVLKISGDARTVIPQIAVKGVIG